jgi:dynein heavy chain
MHDNAQISAAINDSIR